MLHAPAFAQGNVGIGTTSPDASALLDLTSVNSGLLIPRMTQSQRNGIGSPATGLLVFCTDSLDATHPATFYYCTGSAWVPLLSSNPGWLLTGNSGTNASTNFLGTTDAVDFRIRTNNTERMSVTSAGDVGIGTNTPTSLLHTIASGIKSADYTGNLLTNIATSSTASVSKYGLDVLSTGSWTGTNATNIGLHVNATGGATNYSAIFEGGNVGVNTTAPATYVDISGDLATRYSSVTVSNGSNNDLSIGSSSFVRLTGATGAYSITGIAGGVDGKTLVIFNSTTQPFTIANENASSSAANRILTMNSTGDIAINGKAAARLIYSAADSRWIVISSSTTVTASITGITIKKKTVDETRTLKAVLTDDTTLYIPIVANDSMKIQAYIDLKDATTSKLGKLAFTVPSGATMNISITTDLNGAVQQDFLKTSGASASVDVSPEQGALVFGTVVTGATAGNITLQWCQATSGSDILTLVAGSYLKGIYIR